MSDFNFITVIPTRNITSEVETEEPDSAVVFWSADLETRSWGIKDLNIHIEKVIIHSIDKKGIILDREYLPDSIKISGSTSIIPLFVTEVIFSDKEVTVVF